MGSELEETVNLTHRLRLLWRRTLLPISVIGWVKPRAIVRLKSLRKLKHPMASFVELTTSGLVAYFLSQLCLRIFEAKHVSHNNCTKNCNKFMTNRHCFLSATHFETTAQRCTKAPYGPLCASRKYSTHGWSCVGSLVGATSSLARRPLRCCSVTLL